MKHQSLKVGLSLISLSSLLSLGGCSRAHGDPAAEAPPPANVVSGADVNLFTVENPEQFPVAAAIARATAPELVVTGVVNPVFFTDWEYLPLFTSSASGLPFFFVRSGLPHYT